MLLLAKKRSQITWFLGKSGGGGGVGGGGVRGDFEGVNFIHLVSLPPRRRRHSKRWTSPQCRDSSPCRSSSHSHWDPLPTSGTAGRWMQSRMRSGWHTWWTDSNRTTKTILSTWGKLTQFGETFVSQNESKIVENTSHEIKLKTTWLGKRLNTSEADLGRGVWPTPRPWGPPLILF